MTSGKNFIGSTLGKKIMVAISGLLFCFFLLFHFANNLIIFTGADNFNFLVSHISSFITLMPGDIVTTGTPPGVGMGMNPPVFLKNGDEMVLTVENLGNQKIKVIKE